MTMQVDDLVKAFDNVYPVKEIKMPLVNEDGTITEIVDFVIDYERAAQIRSSMTADEIARQRTIM